MEKISTYEVISNALDELIRARELLCINEEVKSEAEGDMLLSDMDSSIERLKEVIRVASNHDLTVDENNYIFLM